MHIWAAESAAARIRCARPWHLAWSWPGPCAPTGGLREATGAGDRRQVTASRDSGPSYTLRTETSPPVSGVGGRGRWY